MQYQFANVIKSVIRKGAMARNIARTKVVITHEWPLSNEFRQPYFPTLAYLSYLGIRKPCIPPSIPNAVPVMALCIGLAKNAIELAISSEVTKRPEG